MKKEVKNRRFSTRATEDVIEKLEKICETNGFNKSRAFEFAINYTYNNLSSEADENGYIYDDRDLDPDYDPMEFFH